MVIGSRDADGVVTQFQCEFSRPQELLVLPTSGIGVSTKTREPLGDFVDVVSVFFEQFTSRTTADEFAFIDLVVPVNLKLKSLTCRQGRRQVNSHHGFNDRVFQIVVGLQILAGSDVETAVENFFRQQALHCSHRNTIETERAASETTSGSTTIRGGLRSKDIAVELQPQILELVGAVVGVANFLRATQRLIFIVKRNRNLIVDLLLPVRMPWRT